MADDVRITNLSDGGSKERVAFDLMAKITTAEHWGKNPPFNRAYYLKLYAQCLVATNGGIDAPPFE